VCGCISICIQALSGAKAKAKAKSKANTNLNSQHRETDKVLEQLPDVQYKCGFHIFVVHFSGSWPVLAAPTTSIMKAIHKTLAKYEHSL